MILFLFSLILWSLFFWFFHSLVFFSNVFDPLILYDLIWSSDLLFNDPLIFLSWFSLNLILWLSDPLILFDLLWSSDLLFFDLLILLIRFSLILIFMILSDPLTLLYLFLILFIDLFDFFWSIDPSWPFLILFIDLFVLISCLFSISSRLIWGSVSNFSRSIDVPDRYPPACSRPCLPHDGVLPSILPACHKPYLSSPGWVRKLPCWDQPNFSRG